MNRFFYLLSTIISVIEIIYIVFTSLFTITVSDKDEDDKKM